MSCTGRVTRALTATGLTLAAAMTFASAAVAAPPPASANALSFSPAKGADTTPMFLVAPKPCPAAATNVVANAVGHGFPAGGQTVVGNTSAGINHTAPFVLPLQDSFTGFAAVNGTPLRGPYRITLRCIDSLGATTFASFTGSVTFSDAHHFTAPAPAKSVVDAIVASQNPTQDASPAPTAPTTAKVGAAPGTAAGKAAPTASHGAGSAASAAQGGTSSPTARVKTTKASHSSTPTWQPWLVVGALLLIAGAVLMRARELRRANRRRVAMLAHNESDTEVDLVSDDDAATEAGSQDRKVSSQGRRR